MSDLTTNKIDFYGFISCSLSTDKFGWCKIRWYYRVMNSSLLNNLDPSVVLAHYRLMAIAFIRNFDKLHTNAYKMFWLKFKEEENDLTRLAGSCTLWVHWVL